MSVLTLSIAFLITVADVKSWKFHPLSDDYIAQINEKATTWKAGRNFDVNEYENVNRLVSRVIRRPMKHDNIIKNPHNEDADMPASFDAREKWPKCGSISEIRDQSACGSSWAVAAASAMSDRICIFSNATQQTRVSYEDLNSCCSFCGSGCRGGQSFEAWYYWNTNGIVTGGLYKSNQGCKDYTLEPCEHHVNGTRPQCNNLNFTTPTCTQTCQNSSMSYTESRTYGQDLVYYFEGQKQIQTELITNGPLEVDFVVYSDFLSYKSGVYQPTSTDIQGSLAVKVIGWGVENNVTYWLMVNSWNEDWGDKGYFKIIRGVDTGGIENNGIASLPRL